MPASGQLTVVPSPSADEPLFRQEALDALKGSRDENGALLSLSPLWLRVSYWLLVALLVAAAAFVALGSINEYASGPAVIRVDDRRDVTSAWGGVVARIAVAPGQHVKRDQVLVDLQSDKEASELATARRELELQLIKVLRDPADPGPREPLAALRGQVDLAAARLASRSLRAPADGVVSDIRIRPGQPIGPGEQVLSLVPAAARFTLIALLPGHQRPYLRRGMPIDAELVGFPYVRQRATVESVGDEIIGPAEARRFLGPDLADAVPLGGAVVVVRARLPGAEFVFDRHRYRYYDGTPAQAEVRVSRRRIASKLIPALAPVFGGADD